LWANGLQSTRLLGWAENRNMYQRRYRWVTRGQGEIPVLVPALVRVRYGSHPRVKNRARTRPHWVGYPIPVHESPSLAPASSDELSFDVSSSFFEDVSSSPHIEPSSPIGSSPEQLVRRSHRLRRPPDCYSSLAFTTTAFSEPVSYRNAILHPE
jgi:hypothetical protein